MAHIQPDSQTARGGWRAGVAQTDVSPPPGVQLVGYPTVIRPNTGIHDPLFASCLVLDNGQTQVLLLAADLVYFEKPFVARLRKAVEAATGIPGGHLFFSCSHTHAGPRMSSHLFEQEIALGGRAEPEYLANLETRLIDLAKRAASNLQDVRVGVGRGKAGSELGIGGNRHDPEGLADPAVPVMGVQTKSGGWLAALVKYSLHPTILQMDNTLVSADYPFGIRRYLAERYPDMVILFTQGAAGDQSSRFFRKEQTFAEAERFGGIIGEQAAQALESIQHGNGARDTTLAVRAAQVEPVWKEIPPIGELEGRIQAYLQELADLETRGAPYTVRQTCYLNRLGTEITLNIARLRAEGKPAPWDSETPIEVQVIRIGDACLVGVAGEIFAAYTLEIERRSPFVHTLVIGLANGNSPGYMIDDETAEKKLFEAGASLLAPQTGQRVVETAARLCRDLFQIQPIKTP